MKFVVGVCIGLAIGILWVAIREWLNAQACISF